MSEKQKNGMTGVIKFFHVYAFINGAVSGESNLSMYASSPASLILQ